MLSPEINSHPPCYGVHFSTYIGSTPNPPRRIRQHNGELTQGAWKTKHNRPWIMQIIVHGFPSKLAALQFEWAWQHPHISRHLRSPGGTSIFNSTRRSQYLKYNIMAMRMMISNHPYNMWPLHVKIFTQEAVKCWQEAMNSVGPSFPLPAGFTCSIELEGVDGKSGEVGSGRLGPIDASDEKFASAHISKHTTLISQDREFPCTICKVPLDLASADALSVSLCPSSHCTAVSHLTCLSRDFLSVQTSEDGPCLIPRGGTCKECQQYVLWGDVIRGCHRRHPGGADVSLEDDLDEGDEELLGSSVGSLASSAGEDGALPCPSARKPVARKKAKTVASTRPTKVSVKKGSLKRGKVRAMDPESEGETFDLDAVSGSEEEGPKASFMKERAKSLKTSTRSAEKLAPAAARTPTKVTRVKKAKAVPSTITRKYHTHPQGETSAVGGEFFDLNVITDDDEEDDALRASVAPSVQRLQSGPSRSTVGERPRYPPAHASGHRINLPDTRLPKTPRKRRISGEVDFFDTTESDREVTLPIVVDMPRMPRSGVPLSRGDDMRPLPSTSPTSPRFVKALSTLSVSSPVRDSTAANRQQKSLRRCDSDSDVILLSD